MAKFRNAQSYYGRTEQAKENQRGNLIPGGPWQKKRTAELRLNCWWEGADYKSKNFMFEGYENNRDSEDVPRGELKDEIFLNNWWDNLELGDKREGAGKEYIYWGIMNELEEKQKAPILENTQKCLKEKLALIG